MKEKKLSVAVLAGGCFWCTEAVFKKLRGVKEVIPGYTGGTIKNPAYREICTGRTGHAEAIRVEYDEAEISFGELLDVFFATHDPTTLNRQGNDVGTQYRSAVFYTTDRQRETAREYITLLEREGVFNRPVVTEITEAGAFYPAETEHKDYYDLHPEQPYCQVVIRPKLKKLDTLFRKKLREV
ncbi:peptide-methionine (S)-S-oxide reductase MsrA [Sinomicrobium soli]|uniref:peptide-methionine (S)-S-oxide reductase MsrA n=1 Tax=Sinomicrobium sp. N-1-3-6 TaxID=2219864 RepID=UPI000DCF607C|nr:peptide-methionine (S)-S-oxide reductase MsrA [Sinomicrobium sp. N-1-3-6]RAV27833.1 peptide-methionine (S)-S-oxide reductase [Sinomicrobium sp. N-1-3-6]